MIALVSRTPLPTLLRTDWRPAAAFGTGFRYLATLGTLVVLFVDPPPAAGAARAGAEPAPGLLPPGTRPRRTAGLATAGRTTDALNVIDLDRVLTTAVNQAGELFSADQVEIELTAAARTVQGSGGRISYDGPSARLVSDAPAQIETRLRGVDGETDVGILRLRFHRPVALSERERYTLRTFAAALCTAVCNARRTPNWPARPTGTPTPPATTRSPGCPTAGHCWSRASGCWTAGTAAASSPCC